MNINYLANILENGGIAVIPTDTIYGLVGDATNEEVIRKIYEIKHREKDKPLLILISNIEMLNNYVENISDLERKIITKFWGSSESLSVK